MAGWLSDWVVGWLGDWVVGWSQKQIKILYASRIPTSPSQNSNFCEAYRLSWFSGMLPPTLAYLLLFLLPPTSLYLLLVGGVGGGRGGGGVRKGGGRREGLLHK